MLLNCAAGPNTIQGIPTAEGILSLGISNTYLTIESPEVSHKYLKLVAVKNNTLYYTNNIKLKVNPTTSRIYEVSINEIVFAKVE